MSEKRKWHRRTATEKACDAYHVRRFVAALNEDSTPSLPVEEHAAGGEPDPPLVDGVAPTGEPQLSLGDHSYEGNDTADDDDDEEVDLKAFEDSQDISVRAEGTQGSQTAIEEKHCFLLCHAAKGSLSRNIILSLACETQGMVPINDFPNFSGRLCRTEGTAFIRAVWCDSCNARVPLRPLRDCCEKKDCTRLLYYRPLEVIMKIIARRYSMDDLIVHKKGGCGFWGSDFLSQLEAKPPIGHGMKLLGAPLSAWALGADGASPLASSTYATLSSHNLHVVAFQCLNVPTADRGTIRACEIGGLISCTTLDGVQRDPKAGTFAAAVANIAYSGFDREYSIYGKRVTPYLIFTDADTPAAAKLHSFKGHNSRHPCLYCRCNRVVAHDGGPLIHRLTGSYDNLYTKTNVTPSQVPRLNGGGLYWNVNTIQAIASQASILGTSDSNGTPITSTSFKHIPATFRPIWGTRIPVVHKLLGLAMGALRTVFPSGEPPDPRFAVVLRIRNALKKSLVGVPKARACPTPPEHLFQKDVARGVKALKLHDTKAVFEWHIPILLCGPLFNSDHEAARKLLSAIRNAVVTVFADPWSSSNMNSALDTLAEVLEGCGNVSLRQHNAHVLTQHLGEQSDQLGPPAFNSEWWVERMVKAAVSSVKQGHHRGRDVIATVARSIAEHSLAKLFASEVETIQRHDHPCLTIFKVPEIIEENARHERQRQVRETRGGGVELLTEHGAVVGIAGKFGAGRRRVELRMAGTPGFLTFDDNLAFVHKATLRFAWLESVHESSVSVRAVNCALVHTQDGMHWFERPADDNENENQSECLELTFSEGLNSVFPCSFVEVESKYVVCGPVPPAAPPQ